jgi:hypothetical protein
VSRRAAATAWREAKRVGQRRAAAARRTAAAAAARGAAPAPRSRHASRRCAMSLWPGTGSRCAPGHVDASLRNALLAAGSWAATRVLGHDEDVDLVPYIGGSRGSAADGRPSRCDVAGDCAVLPARIALAMIDTHVGPNTVWARQGPVVVVRALRNGWPTVTSMCSACSHRAGDCALHPCIAG